MNDIEGYEDHDYLLVKAESPTGTFTFRVIHVPSGAIKMYSVAREQLHLLGYSANSDEITAYFSSSNLGDGKRTECLTFSKSTRTFMPVKIVPGMIPDQTGFECIYRREVFDVIRTSERTEIGA